MRLINTTTLLLEEHFDPNVPPYAILSHTWSQAGQEVTYQEFGDIARGDESAKTKSGYTKIVETCRLARQDGLRLVWIDTCCIDKSSSAELTESINSMFKWYQASETCYVYLEDLQPGGDTNEGLGGCRWFTRGWTLQELLAPTNLLLYDSSWVLRGRKQDYLHPISRITSVKEDVLAGTVPLEDNSIAVRMSWAANRHTTRLEDTAYCLLGLFNVNLSLIYGEGEKAFRRLQEEIIKRSDDMTIFLWTRPSLEAQSVPHHDNGFEDLIARSPRDFSWACGESISPNHANLAAHLFSLTNAGLRTRAPLFIRPDDTGVAERGQTYALLISTFTGGAPCFGLSLRKIGPDTFIRCRSNNLDCFSDAKLLRFSGEFREIFIIAEARNADYEIRSRHVLTFSPNSSLEEDAYTGSPLSHWDVANFRFFPPKPWDTAYTSVLSVEVSQLVDNVVFKLVIMLRFVDGRGQDAFDAKMFSPREHGKLARFLTNRRRRDSPVFWDELEVEFNSVSTFDQTCHVVENGKWYWFTMDCTRLPGNQPGHLLTIQTG